MSLISLNSWFRSYKSILNIHYLKKRLNLRFIFGIIGKLIKESKNKNIPWLTNDSVMFLKNWIKPTDTVLEFGSGASTVWFSRNSKKIISIEHDKKWFHVTKKLTNKFHQKIKLIYAPARPDYLHIFKTIPDNSIDICLVDGQYRRDCLLGSFSKIKIGGIIVLDNAETYLPTIWPSLSFQDSWEQRNSPEKDKVAKIMTELKKWRIIPTSDVSQDTLIFVKNG